MQRFLTYTSAILLSLSVAACSGGGTDPLSNTSPGVVPAGSAGATAAAPAAASAAVSQSAPKFQAADRRPAGETHSIGILASIAGPLKDVTDTIDEAPAHSAVIGACHHGVRILVPDRAGDANSSETRIFYEAACIRIARDTVRIYTPTGSTSENVALTTKNFGPRGELLSTRTTQAKLANATFDARGFPIAADGYDRTASSTLSNTFSQRSVLGDSEMIVAPETGGSGPFCSDSASYNTVGIKSLGLTFGSQGGYLSGATRTTNADGSITWSGTHTGSLEQAPIGAMSIVSGTPNTACPITTPAYTLAGGTVKKTSTSTISATLRDGVLADLSLTRVASNDVSLTASTNAGVWYTNPDFITGSISESGTVRATFSVNAFGDGSLTIAKTGAIYPVIDWTVM